MTLPIVVTCEHATNRIPARLHSLGLTRPMLQSHVAWDPGARLVATGLGRALAVPVLLGRYSRLVADLNRSPRNRKVVPAVAFGVAVPGNQDLSSDARRRRVARYHAPWRTEAVRAIERVVTAQGRCIHLSVHSFVRELRGQIRTCDVGLLYDPSRRRERTLAGRLHAALADRGLHVRRNYPYRGTSDGFTTANRCRWRDAAYVGIEIELNQDLDGRAFRSMIVDALATTLAARSG
jgi:predicted N-formylglutamate amidohydrolase